MINIVKNLKMFLSPVKHFNQRLLNYSQKFALDKDYIFFVRNITQNKSLKKIINIAIQKVSGVSLNAGVLNNSYFNEFDISNLSYHDRCNILKSNSFWIARDFQYRVEVFLNLL